MREVPARRNGCSLPFSGAQITAWICLLLTFLEFLFIVSPVMPIAASIPVTIFFVALNASVCYFGICTLLIDSMDVHLGKCLKERKKAREDGQEDDSSDKKKTNVSFFDRIYDQYNPSLDVLPEEDNMKHCWTCDTQVSEHSMHCKFCNKCVSNFDHHCIWLNTCIGKANYKYFFRTIVATLFMYATHLAVQLGLVIDIYLGGQTQQRAEEWPSVTVSKIVMIAFIVLDAIFIILVGQLVLFHMMLQRKGLTTYQYIIKDHQKRRELTNTLEQLESKRIAAMAAAREEGRTCYAEGLRAGRLFRELGCVVCDPLQPEKEQPPSPPPSLETDNAKEEEISNDE